MKIVFHFKGSIFDQKDPLTLETKEGTTVFEALQYISSEFPKLQSLLFKNTVIRTDILVLVDRTDVKSMQLFDMPLSNEQVITILPLAHGGGLL
ncbi:MAG: MoaD/ThiS family protein [Candidatus Heimdallarchaeota archaeon]|nr:MoaD/ThiS family protein [Candidatus Heimdallarchaeota archaeon]